MVWSQISPADRSTGIAALEVEPLLASNNEVGVLLMQAVQPGEVGVTPVHHIDGSRLGDELVQDAHLVDRRGRDANEGGDTAAQIEKRVQLDPTLPSAEPGPGEKCETQVYRGCIERVNRLVQLRHEAVAGIQPSCLLNEDLGKVSINPPIACFVRIGQSASRDRPAPKAEVVEPFGDRAKARLNVTETLPVRELSEGHGQELVPATEAPNSAVPVVAPNHPPKSVAGQMIEQLDENRAAFEHVRSWLEFPRQGRRANRRAQVGDRLNRGVSRLLESA